MDIKTVGVAGCGIMGSGITQVCAQAGYNVTVSEIDDTKLSERLATIEASLAKSVRKGEITPGEMNAALARIKGTVQVADFAQCDLVIEAVFEDLDSKKKVFAELEAACPERTILASNTSCLSINAMAQVTRRPEKVLGLHFMNPVPMMALLELVTTPLTSEATVKTAMEFAATLGKTIVTTKDAPGFIVNRLMIPPMLTAIEMLEDGCATAGDIDTSLTLGLNHPMGPLKLADLVGLDTVLSIADGIHRQLGEAKYAAPALLKEMVAAGRLGRKTGNGFYDYNKGKPVKPAPGQGA